MEIRAITAFVDVVYPLDTSILTTTAETLRALRQALQRAGVKVQTIRLAIQPLALALGGREPARAIDLARTLEAAAQAEEIDYVSLGPARLSDPPAYVDALTESLRATRGVFASVEIADPQTGIDLPRLRRAAALIRAVSTLSPDGFANARLTTLANVPPWTPFFPSAYHGGGEPRIAIAAESADLAVEAFSRAASLQQAALLLTARIEEEAARIEAVALRILKNAGIGFQGFDFSLAPYPDAARSIGAALERITGPAGLGKIMGAAFLTDTLNRAQFRRTGFCGLMLPVLEDMVLARQVGEGVYTVGDLLACSAVCGTGLDTLPLPGDASEDALMGVLLDVAALALRLNKPLTARLMPLPGKRAGDATRFDFEYFAPSTVMAIPEGRLGVLLAGDDRIALRPLR
jgi:hypothetical protein